MSAPNVDCAGMTAEQRELLRLAFGGQAAQVLYVAARLGLADLLAAGPRSSHEIASAVSVDELAIRRVLRGMVSLGLCSEVELHRFALSAVGGYLRSDQPGSLHARILFNTEVLWPIWGELLDTVRTGNSGAVRAFNMPLYDYLQARPDIGELFDRTMADAARYRVEPALASYDFSRFQRVVDIGGGTGALMLAILQKWPRLQGVVFDLPSVAERARANVRDGGLAARCAVQEGNAIESVPKGADCYVMSNFLVSMSDAMSTTILRNCLRAMAAQGVIIIIEWVMPTGEVGVDRFNLWDTTAMDLNMLAIDGCGGWRVRTAAEFRSLFEASGLTLSRIIPTGSSVSILEAMAA